jgi:hypothetical protein
MELGLLLLLSLTSGKEVQMAFCGTTLLLQQMRLM